MLGEAGARAGPALRAEASLPGEGSGRLAAWLFDGQRAARTWTAGAGALRRVHTCALVLAPTCDAGHKAALSRNEHDGATRDAPAVCAVPGGGRGALGTGLVRAEARRCVKSLPGLKDFV